MSIRVVIFTDAKGWHEAKLTDAFRAVGAESSLVSLANCSFSADSKFGCLTIPGFEDALPDAAFVRGISAGTFEQVTLRLDFLHALTDLSVKVVNSARVIEKTVDKAMTSHLLKRHQVETVPAWTFESRQLALQLIRSKTSQNRQLVLKPLFGSRGRGLKLIRSELDLPEADTVNGVYYLQEFIPSQDDVWRDWRVMVVGGNAVCAMERRSELWITNRAQGAQCFPAQLEAEALELAERAAHAVGADYAGVDIIHSESDGWLVLEINGVPAWRGLQEVSEIDIAKSFTTLIVV